MKERFDVVLERRILSHQGMLARGLLCLLPSVPVRLQLCILWCLFKSFPAVEYSNLSLKFYLVLTYSSVFACAFGFHFLSMMGIYIHWKSL